MKKLFTLIAATMLCVGAQAQSVNINLKNGTTVYYSGNEVEYVDFNETQAVSLTGVKFVKDGKTVEFATTNLGADSPEQPGKYYRWGELTGYYVDQLLRIEEGKEDKPAEYNYAGITSWTDANDPVKKEAGSTWRIPSKQDIQHLLKFTNYWTTENGITGRKFENGQGGYIFLPAVGLWHEFSFMTSETRLGAYWAKDLASEDKSKKTACGLFFGSDDVNPWDFYQGQVREAFLPIRPCK